MKAFLVSMVEPAERCTRLTTTNVRAHQITPEETVRKVSFFSLNRQRGYFFSFRVNTAIDFFALGQAIMEPSIQTLKQVFKSKRNKGLISRLAGGEH